VLKLGFRHESVSILIMFSQVLFLFAECLGYPASALQSKTHDDLCTDAIVTMKSLIGSARAMAEDLDLKEAATCNVDALAGKLSRVPEHVTSLQKSSAIGAARQALFMTLAHNPNMDLHVVT